MAIHRQVSGRHTRRALFRRVAVSVCSLWLRSRRTKYANPAKQRIAPKANAHGGCDPSPTVSASRRLVLPADFALLLRSFKPTLVVDRRTAAYPKKRG